MHAHSVLTSFRKTDNIHAKYGYFKKHSIAQFIINKERAHFKLKFTSGGLAFVKRLYPTLAMNP
jgi:hypothetical protein